MGVFPVICHAQESNPGEDFTLQVSSSAIVTETFQVTFDELGYGEYILESPIAQEQFAFRLPDDWIVEDDSILDIEFSYFFTEFEQREGVDLHKFGEVSILLDGALLDTYVLDATSLERVRWRVDIPPDLVNERPGSRYEIAIILDAWFLCDIVHKGQLIIHPESTLSLNYTLVPPELNLASYPRPFSQWSFEPDSVYFILPAQPSASELRTAVVVAAGLGDLAGGGIVISTTTDVEWLRMVEAGQAGAEDLFVIGQPGRNQLVTWLSEVEALPNEKALLPIPVQRRELALDSYGPSRVMLGEAFTYTISVTNTSSARMRNLTLANHLPRHIDLVNCHPAECRIRVEGLRREVYWSLSTLSLEENASFFLKLKLADTASLSLTVPVLENLVTLRDRTGKLINIDSLSTPIGADPIEERVSYTQNDYFFVRDGHPVFESDGVLEEIISPWDPQSVILLITGLSDQAVHKAGQSLGLDTGLLDMEGPMALVREIRPSSPITEPWVSDFTLADLGYGDRIAYGFYPRNIQLDYFFNVPLGWEYNEAYLILFFDHSEAIDVQNSTLTILLNGSRLATVPLNEEDTIEGRVQIDLPSADIRPGTSNRLSIQSVMQIGEGAACKSISEDQAWVKVSQDSLLHIERRMTQKHMGVLDLDDFPFPFDDQADLGDLLFALPSDPDLFEVDGLLETAFALGKGNVEGIMNPTVFLGDIPDAELLYNYDIVAIGRPTRNPLIQKINAALPQPFIPGTDEVENQLGEVLLRLPKDVPLGYIQEIPSPWNQNRALLAVTGTRDEGLAWATYALNRRAWRLDGDLALLREREEEIEVRSLDTRRLTSSGQAAIILTAVPELTPVSTPTVTPTLGSKEDDIRITPTVAPNVESLTATRRMPTWVKVFLGITSLAVITIVIVGVWRFLQRSGE